MHADVFASKFSVNLSLPNNFFSLSISRSLAERALSFADISSGFSEITSAYSQFHVLFAPVRQ